MLDQRLFPFILLLTVTVNCDNYTVPCPAVGPVYAICSATIAYLFDDSIDLSNAQVLAEFDFIRNWILPGTNWNRDVYMVFQTYGSNYGYPYQPTNLIAGACENLDSLQTLYQTWNANYRSLYDGIAWLDAEYGTQLTNVVIFSRDQEGQDITYAGNYARFYMQDIQFTIVALNGAPFDGVNFIGTIYHVNDITNPPENRAQRAALRGG